jgi:hypothetical protein
MRGNEYLNKLLSARGEVGSCLRQKSYPQVTHMKKPDTRGRKKTEKMVKAIMGHSDDDDLGTQFLREHGFGPGGTPRSGTKAAIDRRRKGNH